MEHDELPSTQPREPVDYDALRKEALAPYDKHPGVALLLLAVIAFLLVVIVYQFAADHVEKGPQRGAVLQTLMKSTKS